MHQRRYGKFQPPRAFLHDQLHVFSQLKATLISIPNLFVPILKFEFKLQVNFFFSEENDALFTFSRLVSFTEYNVSDIYPQWPFFFN